MEFKLHAPFKPTGDQPEAIEKLAQGVKMGLDEQVLLGVTGSGKTFTMASVIEKVQRPTLVLAFRTTTITSPRPISPTPTPISPRTPRRTRRSTACGFRPPARCSSGAT